MVLLQAEYNILASQLSEYTVKLLGHVRSGGELDIILREPNSGEDRDMLARLKMAMRYGEKQVEMDTETDRVTESKWPFSCLHTHLRLSFQFVTHPSCQKKLQYMWLDGWGNIQRKGLFLQTIWCLAFGLCYPFFAFVYWIYPWGEVRKSWELTVDRKMAKRQVEHFPPSFHSKALPFLHLTFFLLVFLLLLLLLRSRSRSSSNNNNNTFRLFHASRNSLHVLYIIACLSLSDWTLSGDSSG